MISLALASVVLEAALLAALIVAVVERTGIRVVQAAARGERGLVSKDAEATPVHVAPHAHLRVDWRTHADGLRVRT